VRESAINTLYTMLSAQVDAVAAQLTQRANALGRRCDRRNVHALRVAARRARALLWTMKPWIDRSLYKECARQLKAITSVLGPMRDMDVLAEIMPLQIATRARLSSAQARWLGTDIGAQRARCRQLLRSAIRSDEFQDRIGKLEDVLLSRSLLRKDLPVEATPWILRMRRDVSRLERRARRAGKKDLHRIRLRAKRCRYALELLGPAAPQKALRQMKKLQASLGRYCDMRLAAAWLKRPGSLHDQVLRKRLLRVARTLVHQQAKAALARLRRTSSAWP
jgi:CHAD domain-containing protein